MRATGMALLQAWMIAAGMAAASLAADRPPACGME
jgi:hypothetical protein